MSFAVKGAATIRLAVGVGCAVCALVLGPAASAADQPTAPRKLWQQFPLQQAPAKANGKARTQPTARPRKQARHEPALRRPRPERTKPAAQAPARREPSRRLEPVRRAEAHVAVSAPAGRDSAPLVPIALGAGLLVLLAAAYFVLLRPAVGVGRVPGSAAALLSGSAADQLPWRRGASRTARGPRLEALLEAAADSAEAFRRLRHRSRHRLRSASLYGVGLAFVTVIAYMISRIP